MQCKVQERNECVHRKPHQMDKLMWPYDCANSLNACPYPPYHTCVEVEVEDESQTNAEPKEVSVS